MMASGIRDVAPGLWIWPSCPHGEPVHDRAAFERAIELPPLKFD